MFDVQRLISERAKGIDASGIRRVFDLAAKMKDPVNLSIGQPDFDVPQEIKEAAIDAVKKGMNRYTQTQGIKQLQEKIGEQVKKQYGKWRSGGGVSGGISGGEDFGVLVTSGVSGGLMLAILACVGPGDEVIIPDPYFVMYKHLVTLAGATAVYVDTYPDFQVTAERLEKAMTAKTKMILFNSPSNPTGVVSQSKVLKEVAELAEKRGVLVVSDEIYDEFCYEKQVGEDGKHSCASMATYSRNILLMRGFSKTWGMTGWRLGWVAGPKAIVEQMTKLQQYSFVCAPSMVQVAGVTAMDVDVSGYVQAYQKKRDKVVEKLKGVYELTVPGGAFYAFPKVPERLGLTGGEFVEKAVGRGLLIIPGNVFSRRDTHFRISYACEDAMLERGLDILLELAKGV